MRKKYIRPLIKVRKIDMETLMLPDSVSGGDGTPPVVKPAKEGSFDRDGEHQSIWSE